jgi:hypothetical protein
MNGGRTYVPLMLAALGTFVFLASAWLLPTWRNARQFLVWHPSSIHRRSDVTLDLRQWLQSRLAEMRTDFASSWRSRWSSGETAIRTLDLRISTSSLAGLNSNLPRSGKDHWSPALLRWNDDTDFSEVSVRYRGDSLHHWGFAEKSWLVRTKSDEPEEGERRWHVILPRWRSAGAYYVTLRMAQRMGILAPAPEIVSLRVNGRQHGGIHLLLPDQGETFLRRNGRLPGDLYVGDMTPLDDSFVNEGNRGGLWQLPWLWQKAANNNKFDPESRRPIELLFSAMHTGTDQEFLELLNLPAWGRFSAYMQLFAANHMDMGHNWKLLYDPGRLSFEPVLGDGNGLPDNILGATVTFPGRDASITTPLLARLHRDHGFLREKYASLAGFFEAGLDSATGRELLDFVDRVSPVLSLFPQLDWIGTVEGMPVRYFNDKDLRSRAARVLPELEAWFAIQRETLRLAPGTVRIARLSPSSWRIEVSGYGPVRLKLVEPGRLPTTAFVSARMEDGGILRYDASRDIVPGSDDYVTLDLPLLAGRRTSIPTNTEPRGTHEVVPVTYDLDFTDPLASSASLRVLDMLGEESPPDPAGSLPELPLPNDNTSLFPDVQGVESWAGVVQVQGVREIRGRLQIEPGTTVRLAPGASIIIRGSLMAEGTPENPIRFERAGMEPWGTVAILSAPGTASRISHATFTGGSGLSTPYCVFSGMLSVYGSDDFEASYCVFAENSEFDDQFHAIYSKVTLRNCEFLRAFGDAVDLDLSEGLLEHLTVTAPGNDSVDLMTSTVLISGSRLLNSGDKGVSAGEGSVVAVFDSTLADNAIGVQAKDGAQALIYNSTITGNGISLSGYHKNLSYTGQVLMEVGKSVIRSGEQPELLDGSLLRIEDSAISELWSLPGLSIDSLSDRSDAAASPDPTASFLRQLGAPGESTLGSHDVRGPSTQ